ncbi:MAG: Na+/H+ antiporter NhaA, partial [Thermoleophilia bacterium]|nr:Na+/H+ antiporter NhaA [Thermoleophilia bacterium]
GVGALAGIGFTVAIFVAGLAYTDPALIDEAKFGILAGSILAGLLGAVILRLISKNSATRLETEPA